MDKKILVEAKSLEKLNRILEIKGIRIGTFNGVSLYNAPEAEENIFDYFDKDDVLRSTDSADICLRDRYACPFGIGGWMINLRKEANLVFFIRFPNEATEEQIRKFVEPLKEAWKRKCYFLIGG